MPLHLKQRIQIISKVLDELFPDPQIPLLHHDPYTLLIAVLLSAQCTDARVNQVTPALFAKASNPFDMIKLSVEEIADLIRTCGLTATKSRAIHKLSQILVEKYGGLVPQTLEELEELPGVGHKTASVVMVQAFHQPAFPVDTHIIRCAQRWGLTTSKRVQDIEAACKKAFPKKEWDKRHLQIILFARRYCPARLHDASICPICSCLSK